MRLTASQFAVIAACIRDDWHECTVSNIEVRADGRAYALVDRRDGTQPRSLFVGWADRILSNLLIS